MPRTSDEERIYLDTMRALEMRQYQRNPERPMRVNMDIGPYPDRCVLTVQHDDGEITHTEVNLRDIEMGRPLHEYARYLAARHAEVYTRPLLDRLTRSIERELTDRFRGEHGGQRYGRSPAMEALRGLREGQRHMVDLMIGGVNYATGAIESKPKKAEAIATLADYPKQIEEVGLVAVLLDDTMKLWQESADLGHCLYRSYTPRIKAGEFIAYHISGIKRSGYTVCFKMSSGTRVYFDPYRERKEKQWVHDQTRGKSNHTNDNPRLLSITGIILARINNVLDQKESVVTIEQPEPAPTTICNTEKI